MKLDIMMFSKSRLALSGAEVAVWALVAGPALGSFYSIIFFVLSLDYGLHPFNVLGAMQVYLFALPFAYVLGGVPSLVAVLLYWKLATNLPYAFLRVLLSALIGPVVWVLCFWGAVAGFDVTSGLAVALYIAFTSALPASISLALIFEARGRVWDGAAAT